MFLCLCIDIVYVHVSCMIDNTGIVRILFVYHFTFSIITV